MLQVFDGVWMLREAQDRKSCTQLMNLRAFRKFPLIRSWIAQDGNVHLDYFLEHCKCKPIWRQQIIQNTENCSWLLTVWYVKYLQHGWPPEWRRTMKRLAWNIVWDHYEKQLEVRFLPEQFLKLLNMLSQTLSFSLTFHNHAIQSEELLKRSDGSFSNIISYWFQMTIFWLSWYLFLYILPNPAFPCSQKD